MWIPWTIYGKLGGIKRLLREHQLGSMNVVPKDLFSENIRWISETILGKTGGFQGSLSKY